MNNLLNEILKYQDFQYFAYINPRIKFMEEKISAKKYQYYFKPDINMQIVATPYMDINEIRMIGQKLDSNLFANMFLFNDNPIDKV